MNVSSTACSMVLTALLFVSGPLIAQTCPQLIFASSFEDGQGTITSVPVDGATNVGLEDIISATFSEKIANDSVNNTTFRLSQAICSGFRLG